MKEKIHFLCLKKYCFGDNNKPAHWVGHSKLRSQDVDELFKITPKSDEKDASVTGNTEEEKNIAKKTTDDTDTNAKDNERIYKDNEKIGYNRRREEEFGIFRNNEFRH